MPTNKHSDNLFDGQAPLDDEQLWDLLSLYVDGEADPAQAAIVEQMLSSDPAYRRDFDFLMQSSQTMRMMEEVEPPLSMHDAVYAKTTGRPTLVGRLRAAWNRATTPSFGRYATIAGAFAVTFIGAVIVWPRLSVPQHSRNVAPPLVAAAHGPHTPVATNANMTHDHLALRPTNPPPIAPPQDYNFTPSPHLELANYATSGPTHRPTGDSGLHNGEKNGIAIAKPGPQNHSLPPINVPDGSTPPNNNYAYEKTMDNGAAPGHIKTIVPAKDDFGPTVVVDDTPTASNIGSIDNPLPKTEGNGTPKPPVPVEPKKTVRVAALPPGAIQNISQAVIRRDINARYDGYDRSVAENIQRHEVTIDVIKGSF